MIAIRSILTGTWSPENSFLVAVSESIPDSVVRDRINELVPLNVPPFKAASRCGASGYVVDTVPLALYCAQFIVEEPLSRVLAQAIEAGGDTDTIASITGKIAGTVAGVPPDYAQHFSKIVDGDEIIQVAESFAEFLRTREEPSAN